MGDILNHKAKNGIEKLQIREAVETDLNDVLLIERLAFGYDKEAKLVRDLLHDPSAKPVLSLLAFLVMYGINFSINSYLVLIIILMILSTKLILYLTRNLKFDKISNYALTAQLFDAINTSFILLFFGGFEKHVIPRAIIDMFGTPLAFIPAKLIVVVPIIYYLNKDKNKLSKLILIAIFVLGMSQGLRNLINVL